MTDMLARTDDTEGAVPGFAEGELRSIIERVERIEADIQGMNADKSDIYKEAKSQGFDVAVLKELIRLRKKDPDERREKETLLDLYARATGTRL